MAFNVAHPPETVAKKNDVLINSLLVHFRWKIVTNKITLEFILMQFFMLAHKF